MLSGAALQVPIYALLSALPVELLAVGPNPDVDVLRFENFKSDEQRTGFLETLRIVAALSEAGRFPIRPGSHCDRCDYRSACRRGHPPTEYREDHAETLGTRGLLSKTASCPRPPRCATGPRRDRAATFHGITLLGRALRPTSRRTSSCPPARVPEKRRS
jgi:hypothetical protein